MKKLMVAFAAVAMAIVANAGAVQWDYSGLIGSDKSADPTGYLTCFLIDSGAGYTGSSAYLQTQAVLDAANGDFDFLSNTLEGWMAPVYSENGSATDMNVAEGDFVDTTSSAKGYLVIFDADSVDNAKNYFITSAQDIELSLGAGSITFDVSGSATGWQSMEVPEPTSGLLLLVGLGAMALRRRRA